MLDNASEVAQIINIEMANKDTQSIIKKSSNPENGNEVAGEERAVVSPQVKDLANKNQDDDFINGLIAGLEDMVQEPKKSETKEIEKKVQKKIEKKAKDKAQEVMGWISAIIATAYVFL